MNLLEMIDRRNQVKDQLEQLIKSAETEQRKLTSTEDTEFRTLKDELKELNQNIEKSNNTQNEEQIMRKFSLIETINNVVNKRNQDEGVQALINLGKEELRKAGQNAQGDITIPMELRADITSESGAGIAKDTANLITALKSNLVLTQAGATYMGGLTGNVGIPTYSGTTVAWADETGEAADGAGALSEVLIKPKRLTAYVDVSKQFLIQESADAERVLREDIAKAIAVKLESTILGDVAGTDNRPAGLMENADVEAFDATLIDMELDEKNVQNKVYILSPKAKNEYVKSALVDSVSAAYFGGKVMGYPTFTTTAIVKDGMIAGDFSDLVIGQWGGLDITVDPYTQASKGKVRLVVNAFFDAAARRDAFVGKVIEA